MMFRKGLWAGCLLLLVMLSAPARAAEKQDTLRVLFVGNSYVYYNNLAQLINLLTDSMPTRLICTKSTVGAAHLGEHWRGLRGLRSKTLISEKKYDIIVIQDNSMWPLEHKDSLLFYGKLFTDLIRSTGARPYLYSTWARQKTPETQTAITAAYTELATATGAVRVPVGDAWELARQQKPEMVLFHSDGSHPSALGTFLIALSFIKKITGTRPARFRQVYNYPDKDGESFRLMQLTEEEMKLCAGFVEQVQSKQ
ncbi:MAG: hypothetical protein ACK57C_01780 [Bacteroidota bacterium]